MPVTSPAAVTDARQEQRRAREERGLRPARGARTDRLPPAPRERRPMLAALAVLLVVGGAVMAGMLAMRADERVPVLVAARDIAVGAQITQEALTQAPVAAEGTMLVPVERTDLVVGQYARTTITQGQLLDESMVTGSGLLQPGKVAVGASLAGGRYPASGLQSGDVVQLVDVTEPRGSVVLSGAVVSSAYEPAAAGAVGPSSGTLVTFIVDERSGAEVAAVASAGDLAVVLVTRGATDGS